MAKKCRRVRHYLNLTNYDVKANNLKNKNTVKQKHSEETQFQLLAGLDSQARYSESHKEGKGWVTRLVS